MAEPEGKDLNPRSQGLQADAKVPLVLVWGKIHFNALGARLHNVYTRTMGHMAPIAHKKRPGLIEEARITLVIAKQSSRNFSRAPCNAKNLTMRLCE